MFQSAAHSYFAQQAGSAASLSAKRRHSQPVNAMGSDGFGQRSTPHGSLTSPSIAGSGGGDDDDDRENKIRIVAKLEKVENLTKTLNTSEAPSSAPLHPPADAMCYRDQQFDYDDSDTESLSSSSSQYSSHAQPRTYQQQQQMQQMQTHQRIEAGLEGGGGGDGSDGDEEDLLDDAGLMELGDDQLEEVLERMLMRVISQLVHVAGGDEDLRDELNAPDHNGFCLLHYAYVDKSIAGLPSSSALLVLTTTVAACCIFSCSQVPLQPRTARPRAP